MKKDFLSIAELNKEEIDALFELAKDLKTRLKAGKTDHLLKGKTLAMIFQKPSMRTRVSFETGMVQLGGHALYLSPAEIGLGKRESAADVARVISRFNDGIMARLFGHDLIEDLAKWAAIPVINGLTDFNHPCQILGDLLTIDELFGTLKDLKIAYVGDGNNIVHSWLNAAAKLPMTLSLAHPEGYDPDPKVVKYARDAGVSQVDIVRDPMEAVKDADVIYTDVWASMGQEEETAIRKKVFADYQINMDLIRAAKPTVKVLHCLPAHRGDEITDEVMDGPYSAVFQEAENRLHIQKAILVTFMGDKSGS